MKYPEEARIRSCGLWSSDPGDSCGVFILHGPCGRDLRVLASDGEGWEHVSVSMPKHAPNWQEMDFVKRSFWDDSQAVMQLHPPRENWVNNHSFCLHLWRPLEAEIPLPPDILVGFKELGVLSDTQAERRL